ncbi:MAG: class I SAM-dependent methyltransferase [Parachlamydiaceae bacterium]|nr:class I SAM-dependent methyltransferase [Parachlamydiaceae bacterium]
MKSNRSPANDLETILPLLINVWRRFHKQSGPGDRLQTREFRRLVGCLQQLRGEDSENKKEANKHLPEQENITERERVAANLLYPWIIHYQEALSLLGELPGAPKRVLDVCSGTAPFAFAALRHGASEVFATDRNVAALELGAEVAGRYGMPLTLRKWDCLKEAMPIEGDFDLITVGHALGDLFPINEPGWKERQSRFITYLLSRLKKTGFLLLVESSYLEDNRRILEIRDELSLKNIVIQAPCVWQGDCPTLKTPNSPCYAQREMAKPYHLKEIQRAMGIKLSSLKMTYLLIKSPKAEKLIPNEHKLYRVISPPSESYQGKRFYLCGTDGKKTLSSHLDEHPSESRAFEHLRRGELIEIVDPLEQGQAFDIVQGTEIIVRAPCGKPVPTFENFDDSF